MVQVTTKYGVLEGEKIQNPYGGSYYSFKGIPYAKPPIGELRFKAPQPLEPWTGVQSAKEHGPVCIQHDEFKNMEITGSEDCLYLNVYTPEIKPIRPLPVMIYIHGGGFTVGSGNDDRLGPEFLVNKDVILVTINYRLYILGFLCLDTPDIPGNAGMKDQVAAMRWVKENISNFGGDPENITIFGESAGGASVSWHLISPMTKGFFKRAIIQSGSAISTWSIAFEPRDKAIALTRKCGLDSEDNTKIINLIRSLPATALIEPTTPITLAEKAFLSDLQFNIVSEKDFGQERFFYGDVFEALRKGVHEGIEIISGYCEHEGICKLGQVSDYDKCTSFFTEFRELFVPRRLALNISLYDQFEVGRLVKKHFYGDKNITKHDLLPLIQFIGWDIFVYDIIQAHRYYTKRNIKTYLYKFTCKSKRNIYLPHFVLDPNVASELGEIVCHADDLAYLFRVKAVWPKIEEDSVEYKLIENVTTLWTNFAKYGDPTPDNSMEIKWAPYTLDGQEYLEIGNKLTPGTKPDHEIYQFFDTLFKKYMSDTVV